MDSMIPSGQIAPDFSLPDLDGRVHRLSQAFGRLTVLNFWSAECPWAERADREVEKYLNAWGGAVQLWTIASNSNEPIELLRRVSLQRGLPLVLLDSQHTVADLYQAQATPHFFVIDAEGILRYQGAMDDVAFRKRSPERFYLQGAVEALLSGRLPDPAETPAYGCAIVRYQ